MAKWSFFTIQILSGVLKWSVHKLNEKLSSLCWDHQNFIFCGINLYFWSNSLIIVISVILNLKFCIIISEPAIIDLQAEILTYGSETWKRFWKKDFIQNCLCQNSKSLLVKKVTKKFILKCFNVADLFCKFKFCPAESKI